jgi:hypothetical protein
MKNFNDTIGNRTRDLPARSAVTQPTAPPRAPLYHDNHSELDTNSYELVSSQLPLLLPVKVLRFSFESPCIVCSLDV